MSSSHPPDIAPDDELDPSLVKLACQNRIKNRSKRSPEWIFFADAGMWQTVNGDESKFRIANCRYCLKADIQTKIRGKIETMKNHIMECDKIPASQKAVYERHPGRYRKRANTTNTNIDAAKRLKFDGLLKAGAFTTIDGHENRAVVLHGTHDLRIDRVPIPSIPPGHVLIAMRSVGICGSDVHYWTNGRIGDFIVKKPMTLGHEGSGVVRLVGEDVEGFDEGDRIAIEPGLPCSKCTCCKDGRYNLCPSIKFSATPPINGNLAYFVVHPASHCYKLPPMVSFDEAALFEPLSVGIHACRRGNVTLGHKILITGAGPIGLVCMLVAKASGASQVVIHDIDSDRLQVAKELGADRVHVTHIEADPKITVEGLEADVCIDATGVESAIKTCIYGCKRGGTVVLVGMGKSEISLPILDACIREVDLRGVFRYCNTYPTALQLVSSGKVNVKRLVTHRFKMHDAEDAFEAAKDRNSKSIKVIIDCVPPPLSLTNPTNNSNNNNSTNTSTTTTPTLAPPHQQPQPHQQQTPQIVAQQQHHQQIVAPTATTASVISPTSITNTAPITTSSALVTSNTLPPPLPHTAHQQPSHHANHQSNSPQHNAAAVAAAAAAVAAAAAASGHNGSSESPIVVSPTTAAAVNAPSPAVVSAAMSAATVSTASAVPNEPHWPTEVGHQEVVEAKVDGVFSN